MGEQEARANHKEFLSLMANHDKEHHTLLDLSAAIVKAGANETVYTSLTREGVSSLWSDIQLLATRRAEDLDQEAANQKQREITRKSFAQKANALGHSLDDRLQEFRDRPYTGTLEV